MSPEAMATLQAAVKASTQAAVADKLGCSRATVSLVLAGSYPASTARLEAKVLELLPPPPPAPPVWLDALRTEAQRIGQQRLAMKLDIAESTLSQVLSGSYKAATTRIERRVRGLLLGEECECPALGEITLFYCQSIQDGPRPSSANPPRLHAWWACRGMSRFGNAGPCKYFNGGKPQAASPATSAAADGGKEHP